MTELDEAGIRARLEAATEGPWELSQRYYAGSTPKPLAVFGGPGSLLDLAEVEDTPDAEFIAHARTDVEQLLAALDAARTGVNPAHERTKQSLRRMTLRAEAALAQVERLHFDLDREARARQAAEGALAAVRVLADRWATEADDRGDDDLLYTRGVANMLDAALATPTTTEETN